MKSILKIFAAVLLVVGSFGVLSTFENARDKAATEEIYVARVQGICEREGVIYTQHHEDFVLYFRCVFDGAEVIEKPPLPDPTAGE